MFEGYVLLMRLDSYKQKHSIFFLCLNRSVLDKSRMIYLNVWCWRACVIRPANIAFAAYKVYKELERQLKKKKAERSPEKAIEIAKTIFSVQVTLTQTGETLAKTIYTRDEQKILADLFGF
jgi:hypothetical protein